MCGPFLFVPHAITGAQTLNARFPGQWFQLESSLAYNWHRHYDASIGRYTQPDPLGFVDGPSVYAYAAGRPATGIDRDGRLTIFRVPRGYTLVPPSSDQCGSLGYMGPPVLAPPPSMATPVNDPCAGSMLNASPSGQGEVNTPCGFNGGGGGAKGGPSGPNTQINRPDFAKQRKEYWENEAQKNPQNYSSNDLTRMQDGKPPIGSDGKPMELHHQNGKPDGPLVPMTRENHRIGPNYRSNHPWLFPGE